MRALLFVFVVFCSAALSCAAPMFPVGAMDKTLYSQKGAALRICYDSFDVVGHTRVMGADVPTAFRLNGLRIFAEAANITENELLYAKTKLPFSLSANGFSLTINGKKTRLAITADSAVLTPLNTVVLKGNVKLSTAKTVSIGERAALSLEGRMIVLQADGTKVGFKF